MWCLSARWDDITRLTRASIQIVPEGWLIHIAETKSSNLTDYRPDAFIPLVNPPDWMYGALMALGEADPITLMTTDAARRSMAGVHPSPNTIASFPSCRGHFTPHSPKRGAQTCLWQHAALGQHVSRFGPLQIAMMGGHKTPQWAIPSTSVRYAADKFAMAKALGLHHASSHLLQSLLIALGEARAH